jgi:hypothetical protein
MKHVSVSDGFSRIEPQAVELNDAGVTGSGLEVHRRDERSVEQLAAGVGAYEDREAGPSCAKRIDDLDLTRRVTEAVAGDEKGDQNVTLITSSSVSAWTKVIPRASETMAVASASIASGRVTASRFPPSQGQLEPEARVSELRER